MSTIWKEVEINWIKWAKAWERAIESLSTEKKVCHDFEIMWALKRSGVETILMEHFHATTQSESEYEIPPHF